jgi:hypothetical protein
MALAPETPIACANIGNGPDLGDMICCFPNAQQNCSGLLGNSGIFPPGCPSGTCSWDCGNPSDIFGAQIGELDVSINNVPPIQRFLACANVPSVANSDAQGLLPQELWALTRPYIAPNLSDDTLANITSVVTDCLSSTCRNSRQKNTCYDDYCSPVKLLTTHKQPNLTAMNSCLHKLCTGGANSLSFGDADIIGIGVCGPYCGP